MKSTLIMRRRMMIKLSNEEAKWLDSKWNDFYYYFDVESMYQKDQEIFRKIGQKLSEVKQ
tara:strand:- start:310 stop:489 length:180 start_codon:yes stop_codon:yes gene_type:complete